MKMLMLIVKNMSRNWLRSVLTALGSMVLVFVVTLVWTVLYFLDKATTQKANNLKAIVTERWQIPSRMPFAYASTLVEGAAREPDDVRPADSMTWQFYGGSLEKTPNFQDPTKFLFAFAMEPRCLLTMMDELDELTGPPRAELEKVVASMENNRQGIILGPKRLESFNKRVGERIKLYGLNYKDIDLEFEIVGAFPGGRYDNSAAFHRDYLNEAMDAYARNNNGKKHPMADRSLNLVWLRVPDAIAFEKVSDQIARSPNYSVPAVKCETASSGIATFLDAYRDLLWGMRWLLSPAIIATLALVIANAISISVRERRTEMAVLKVLGFAPWRIMTLVLGEALLLGAVAGFGSALLTYLIININGLPFAIAFFPNFFVPIDALWWGLSIGSVTALIGSAAPALSARNVRVADVFAKIG